jgi:DNA-binding NarL/FixJ family response regulator
VLSSQDKPALLRTLLNAGICGYLHKSASSEELLTAVRAVRKDGDRVVLNVSRQGLELDPQVPLTDRERDVLVLTAKALSNGQIARRLSLTEATVKRHLRNVFAKLGAGSRIDAVNRATTAGLIAPEHTDL